jgi:glycerol-3-phosphate O-acyltransferase/dihydroxyacetone phosphate acyltransferase
VYALLRAIAGIALRWYYRDIHVEGLDRVPRHGPVLLVVNHPNALVDALVVGWILPRRVLITAKATIFANPIAGALLRSIGVVPLRRAKDEASPDAPLNPTRNRGTFEAVHRALARNGTVLIFPEGKSHDEPSLAPLKTGAARMALHASGSDDVRELAIIPIGLTFERKDVPRSRVFVQIGEPIRMASWTPPVGGSPAEALTAEIDTRLRAVTLNYSTADDAARRVRLASVVAALFDDVPPLGQGSRPLGDETAIARRIDHLATRLPSADANLRLQADRLIERLEGLQRLGAQYGIMIEDIGVLLDFRMALRFVVREGWLLLIGGPIALWGRLNHWLPFRAAQIVAMRSVESAADPAMRTLVAGTVFVLLTYLAQTAVVTAIWGPLVGIGYLASLPIAAEINFRLSDRMRRALCRARAFLRFRRDPALHEQLRAELSSLRADVLAFDQALGVLPVEARV